MLINDMSIVKNYEILSRFKYDSDHRVCKCKLQIENRIRYRGGKKKKIVNTIIPRCKMDENRTREKSINR